MPPRKKTLALRAALAEAEYKKAKDFNDLIQIRRELHVIRTLITRISALTNFYSYF